MERFKWNDKINIDKEQWKTMLINEKIINKNNLDFLLRIYSKDNHMATASEITSEENKHSSSYNSMVYRLGERIIKHLNIEAPRQKNDRTKFNYWHVMFLGAREPVTNHFIWCLRPELKEALEDLIKQNVIDIALEDYKNTILPEEISHIESIQYFEGSKQVITVNAYERNVAARRKCIEYYKKKDNGRILCQICKFDFADFYGEFVEGVIHVHHLTPLHEIGESYEVDPIKDLLPVCPNCHMVIHSEKEPLTPKDLIEIINKNKLNKVGKHF